MRTRWEQGASREVRVWRAVRQGLVRLRKLVMRAEDYCHARYVRLELRAGRY